MNEMKYNIHKHLYILWKLPDSTVRIGNVHGLKGHYIPGAM